MEENETKATGIITALCSIMEQVAAIGKTDRNTSQNFNFRSIDAVYNELHALFASAGVMCIPKYISHETEQYSVPGYNGAPAKTRIHRIVVIDYVFVCKEDGTRETIRAIGEGADYGDKSLSKSLAIADKYALLQAFKIPTEDTKDPDAESFDAAAATGNNNGRARRSFEELPGCAKAADQNALVDACAAANVQVSEVLVHYGYHGLENIPGHMVEKLMAYLMDEAKKLNRK